MEVAQSRIKKIRFHDPLFTLLWKTKLWVTYEQKFCPADLDHFCLQSNIWADTYNYSQYLPHPLQTEELIKFSLYCGVPINLQSIINELCSLQISLIQVHSQSIQSAHHS